MDAELNPWPIVKNCRISFNQLDLFFFPYQPFFVDQRFNV